MNVVSTINTPWLVPLLMLMLLTACGESEEEMGPSGSRMDSGGSINATFYGTWRGNIGHEAMRMEIGEERISGDNITFGCSANFEVEQSSADQLVLDAQLLSGPCIEEIFVRLTIMNSDTLQIELLVGSVYDPSSTGLKGSLSRLSN
ncbi:MAG: hypothetical protein MJE77_43420 [Proteobacteria bacterium]|nr:hypothetical protein [Pseudomonadota bacterium]